MPKVKFILPVKVKKATPLLKAADKAGVHIKTSCLKGRCGKCAVRVVGEVNDLTDIERKHFTEEELALGYRLACLVQVTGKCKIELL